VNILEALDVARRQMTERGISGSEMRLESELLLARVLETSRSFLYAHPEQNLPARHATEFRALVQRRIRGEPIAYILGEREFWSMTLHVNPAVLIPRPETETLVSAALENLPAGKPVRVADLGTGSGAIALALARERPLAEVHASDIIAEALDVARGNAQRLGITNIQFHLGSWCAPLKGRFELIASNPPYVSGLDPHLDRGDCRFEPRIALTPGGDGLAAIRSIARAAPAKLARNGWLVMEHGHDQGSAVRALLMADGYRNIDTLEDLQGLDRITLGLRP
jgi:release factor glutamine methyltransferase